MKGVFVFSAHLHDIIFMSVDHEFRSHCMRLASSRGFTEEPVPPDDNNDDFTMNADIVIQLFAPLLSSQQFVKEELNMKYHSLLCSNGFVIVLAEYCNHMFVAMNGDGTETEEFLNRKLAVLNRIITFRYGPLISELKLPSAADRISSWCFMHRLLSKWCELFRREQSFLCEAVEMVNHNSSSVNGQCMSLLESLFALIKKSTGDKASLAGLLIDSRWLTFYSGSEVPSVYTADKLLLILLVKTLFENGQSRHGSNDYPDSERNIPYPATVEMHSDSRKIPRRLSKSIKISASYGGHQFADSTRLVRSVSEMWPSGNSDWSEFSKLTASYAANSEVETFTEAQNIQTADFVPAEPSAAVAPDFIVPATDLSSSWYSSCSPTGSPWTVVEKKSLNYRRLVVFLQEDVWNYVAHTVHCISIDDEITLVVLCEVSQKRRARQLFRLIELIRLVFNSNWKAKTDKFDDIILSIDSTISSLSDLPSTFPEFTSTGHNLKEAIDDLLEVWQSLKSNDLSKSVDAAGSDIDPSSARQLQDLGQRATALFRLLFFLPRPAPTALQNGWPSVMREAKALVTRSLRDYRSFITVAARDNPYGNSTQFPSILHFIFVDRNGNQMLSSSLPHAGADSTNVDFGQTIKDDIWKHYYAMRQLLLSGFTSSTAFVGDHLFSYELCIEDAAGNRLPINKQVVNSQQMPGTLCNAFYRQLMRSYLTRSASAMTSSSMAPAIRCYELFCVYAGPVLDGFVRSENRRLVSQIYQIIGDKRRAVVALF